MAKTPASAALAAPVACPGCWKPAPNTSWQWQLSGTVDRAVNAQMYDIDMFEATPALVADLHARGRRVMCYVDAGSWERFRPDAARFPASVRGKPLAGWPGERWLDIRRLGVLGPLLQWRIDRCAAKGFDGVEFDNVDGYQNPTGFRLTAADQLRFNTGLPTTPTAPGWRSRSRTTPTRCERSCPTSTWSSTNNASSTPSAVS